MSERSRKIKQAETLLRRALTALEGARDLIGDAIEGSTSGRDSDRATVAKRAISEARGQVFDALSATGELRS